MTSILTYERGYRKTFKKEEEKAIFSLPNEVTEAVTKITETLLPVYFNRGYTGLKKRDTEK